MKIEFFCEDMILIPENDDDKLLLQGLIDEEAEFRLRSYSAQGTETGHTYQKIEKVVFMREGNWSKKEANKFLMRSLALGDLIETKKQYPQLTENDWKLIYITLENDKKDE